jgi:tetratricopeptide (TPR) repeat protein
VALSPDGKTALTGSGDGTARLWDTATAEPLGEPLRHRSAVVAVAFSPDGRTALTGSEDGTARLWDAATGRPVGEPLRHRGPLAYRAVAFSPDGRTVLTGSQDGTARLWDARTGLPVGPPWRHEAALAAVAFAPTSRAAVTADAEGAAQLWRLPTPEEGPAAQVALRVEVRTGRRLDADRMVRLLPSADWTQAARRLEEAGEPPTPSDALSWHRRQARYGEAAGNWFLAAWHLGRLIEAGPDQPSLRSRRGRTLLQMGQTERAVSDYSRAIELQPGSAGAWFDRGHAFRVGREWEKAVADLSRAIDLDPNHGPAWHQRGYARAALGQWDRAAEDLAEAVKRPGTRAEALSHQAFVCLQLRDVEGYRKACQALLQRSPRETDVNAVALAAWTCAVSPEGVDPRRALPQAALGNDGAVRPYALRRAAGAAHYRAGDFEAAVRSLHEALNEARRAGTEGPPTVCLLLALAERRRGKDPAQAREWLDKARAWVADARKPAPEGAGPRETAWDRLPWPDRVALELLLAEAEAALNEKAPDGPTRRM